MNLQVISAPDGEILWVSGPLPGATHDLTAARTWGIMQNWPPPASSCWRTRAISAPVSRCRLPTGPDKATSQKAANRAHASDDPGERADAEAEDLAHAQTPVLPWARGQLAKTIHVLQARRSPDEKGSVNRGRSRPWR